jgi:uncharacterized protein (TIGR04255 family)
MTDAFPLPDFEEPPVVEVALAVHFQPMAGLSIARLGAFWAQESIRKGYPNTSERPRMEPFVENEMGTAVSQVFRVGLSGSAVQLPCAVMASPDYTRLIQLQPDMLVQNWRRGSDPYPRYDSVRADFEQTLQYFFNFLDEEGVREWSPIQSEVTYVNHVQPGEQWGGGGDIELVLEPWRGTFSDGFLWEVEDAQIHTTHRLPREGEFKGRLHIEARRAVRQADGKPILSLTLTGRSRVSAGAGLPAVLRELDFAHVHVVCGFRSLTTKVMHQVWKEKP